MEHVTLRVSLAAALVIVSTTRVVSAQNIPATIREAEAQGADDFIGRAGYSGAAYGFQAGEEHKVLWIPLHGSSSRKFPLVVRAARIDNPADSVRFRVEGLAHGGGSPRPLYGYPSEVSFPSVGQWVVVATAGNDWGCFVLDVEPHRS